VSEVEQPAEMNLDELELADQDEESSEPLDLAPEERRLVTQPYDFPVTSLIEDINSGRLLLELEYQRSYVWDDPKASRLVESLLLNVPIPVCYFAENEDGSLEVVDGQQRLKSIWRFANQEPDHADRLELRGLPVLTELNGKVFSQLPNRDQRRLLNRTVRCIVITEDSHPDIKFDVFERLNTGAVRLTDQELRNSIYRGPFNDALKDAAALAEFQQALNGQLTTRMGDVELVLRFVALSDRLAGYRPPLRQFLNEYMREHRASVEGVQNLLQLFRETSETVELVFGTDAFRRVTPGDVTGRQINKALFDATMLAFSLADQSAIRSSVEDVRRALTNRMADANFEPLIGRATADRTRMFGRISAFSESIEGLGIETRYESVVPSE
jgi:hypothetical protein